MKIHKVRNPFVCRIGQFREEKRDLCVGIKTAVLRQNKEHTVQVGNKVYKTDCLKALEIATEKNSWYDDGSVAIIPMYIFKEIKNNS